MQFLLDTGTGNQIRSYKPGQLQVNDTVYTQSVIITPNQLLSPWAPQTITELQGEHLLPVKELSPPPHILLIGTGAQQHRISTELLAPLIELGIGIETMNTSAACRTYNVLMAEGRKVAAMLLVS